MTRAEDLKRDAKQHAPAAFSPLSQCDDCRLTVSRNGKQVFFANPQTPQKTHIIP